MIQKTAFEILQSKLTIEDTFDFREKHIPEILEAMEEYKAQPIELPSDDDIENRIKTHNPYPKQKQMHIDWANGFERGAQWMKEQIQGGNK